jgi:AraC-like DNA-binding protein
VKLDHPITKLFSRVSKGSAPIQKKTDVVGQVQEVVVNYFVHGEPDREIVASELNLSPRTLQRRLKEQNSSVKRTVDSTRHQLSISYLEQKHLSVKEVAYSLGFNDPSNFSRAFRRWEGITPKEYRKAG